MATTGGGPKEGQSFPAPVYRQPLPRAHHLTSLGTGQPPPKMLAVTCLLLAALSSTASSANLTYRLPDDLVPEVYDLRILTNIADLNDNYTFEGDVAILMEFKNSSRTSASTIVLHSVDLNIDSSKLRVVETDVPDLSQTCRGGSISESDLNITSTSYDKHLEYFLIELGEPLQSGRKYTLCLAFEGLLTPGLAGYYRSSYMDQESGQKRWLAVTQFESTEARKAFPCFDEPAMKAKFRVTLGHVMSKSSVSNMPLDSTEPIEGMDGWVWDKFQETVPMSTYLLAFMVSDLKYETSPSTANNVEFRIWARKDALPQVKFASEIGPKVLQDYEDYFNIKYPLPKQDMVAVPDFSAGAMENWGLITYRETALLFDPKYVTASHQPYVVNVIAHEIAHQWFGNLVTMRWWTDLWLNEGFATYMAAQETEKLFPEWRSLEESTVNGLMTVFSLDALKSSHPISVPVGHPQEIDQIFDNISYKKGSYMLQMMNRFLGEETFRSGVSKYLKKHQFGNAEQDDLWDSLTAEAQARGVLPANMTVKEIMDTWTLQTGYPLITVERDYKTGEAVVRQKRYFAERTEECTTDNSTWWVPLTYTTASERDFNTTTARTWIPAGSSEVSIKGLQPDDWILFNIQLSGLYRVKYDEANWRKLATVLNTEKFEDIPLLNRVQLLDDSFDLAKSGDLDYAIPLNLLSYVKREREYLPWKSALSAMGHLDKLLERSVLYGPYKSFSRSLIAPIYNVTSQQVLEEKPSNLQQIKLQSAITDYACHLNVADCRARAVHLYRQWMASSNPDEQNPVPKNSRDVVYCYAIKEGGEDEWNFAWRRYLHANVGQHKSQLLGALACTREAWLLNRYLRWGIDEKSGIKLQDSRLVFSAVTRNDLGYFLAKSFFRQNIASYYRHHGDKMSKLTSYVRSLASHIHTQEELNEFIEFTEKNSNYLAGASQGVKQAIESAKINVKWHMDVFPSLSRFLPDPLDNSVIP